MFAFVPISYQQGVESMKSRSIYSIVIVSFCLAAIILLRAVLINLGFPDGAPLEELAQQVRGREVPIEEAVAAFCESLVNYGAR